MAGLQRQIYLNDSKSHVRGRLGLQGQEKDEDFSMFESFCENVYQYKLSFDPQAKWKDLESTVSTAQIMIKEKCRKEDLKLGDIDVIMDDLSEWKLYQLHRTAKKKENRPKKQTNNAAGSSTLTINPPTSTSKAGSSKGFDPVKAAAEDAARNSK